jgi:hypothetical protein
MVVFRTLAMYANRRFAQRSMLSREAFMMTVFQKLNLKDQTEIVVLNAPESFEPELAGLRGVEVLRTLDGAGDVTFALAFVTTQKDLNSLAKVVAKKAKGDAVVWFAYPKGTSKKYKSEINRDHGWDLFGKADFEPVRSIAIDEDWTGLRFRRAEFIKSMTRDPNRRMSAEGKARAGKK